MDKSFNISDWRSKLAKKELLESEDMPTYGETNKLETKLTMLMSRGKLSLDSAQSILKWKEHGGSDEAINSFLNSLEK
jgi:hypothetical protein